MRRLLAPRICFIIMTLALSACRESAKSRAFQLVGIEGAEAPVEGQIGVLPHTRLRVRLAAKGPTAGEHGRAFVSRPGEPLRDTAIVAAPDGDGLVFTIDVGQALETQAGEHLLHLATSTRSDVLLDATERSPGVGWVRVPLRYALTPSGIGP